MLETSYNYFIMKMKNLIIAGVLSGLAMNLIEYVIHGILMRSVYTEYALLGVMDTTGTKPLQWLHYPINFLLGFPLAYIYSIGFGYFKKKSTAVINLSFSVGIIFLSITSALYTFYNLGTLIPIVISIDKFLECLSAFVISSFFVTSDFLNENATFPKESTVLQKTLNLLT